MNEKKQGQSKGGEQAEMATAILAAICEKLSGLDVGGMDDEAREALNLGISIGAATGAEVGAAAAIRAIERERKNYKRQQYDWKFRNTKLLLRNYRRLTEYCNNAVFDVTGAEEADENFEELMCSVGRASESDEIFVESIQKNYVTTRIIMAHVDKMLDCYRIMCERSSRPDDARHWRVLHGMYIAEGRQTAESLARQEHIDKRTVYKDIDICTSDLTALLFGVGGIER